MGSIPGSRARRGDRGATSGGRRAAAGAILESAAVLRGEESLQFYWLDGGLPFFGPSPEVERGVSKVMVPLPGAYSASGCSVS